MQCVPLAQHLHNPHPPLFSASPLNSFVPSLSTRRPLMSVTDVPPPSSFVGTPHLKRGVFVRARAEMGHELSQMPPVDAVDWQTEGLRRSRSRARNKNENPHRYN